MKLKSIRLEYDAHLVEMNKVRFDHFHGKESTMKDYYYGIYNLGQQTLERAWQLKGNIKLKKKAMIWIQLKLILIMITLIIGMSALIAGCWWAAYLAMLIAVISLGTTLILWRGFK